MRSWHIWAPASRSGTPACTEPGAGSDVSALTTNYKRRDGHIYLNGTKTFITSSKGVKWLVVMAKNADDPSIFTEFMVDISKPGIELGPLDKLGLRMDSCCEVYFNDVELDESEYLSARKATASTAASLTSTSSAGW